MAKKEGWLFDPDFEDLDNADLIFDFEYEKDLDCDSDHGSLYSSDLEYDDVG